jgi:hypothetical protein
VLSRINVAWVALMTADVLLVVLAYTLTGLVLLWLWAILRRRKK